MAPEVLTVAPRGDVLEAFSGTLDREVHNLRRRADPLWPQPNNRCCSQQVEMLA